jgi:PIN domain nuclease of toxin-antitoxin system
VLTPTETETAQQRAVERGVLLATCRAAGATNDTAKTEDMLKTGVATVPRATFMTAMAYSLFHFSQLYAKDKLDEPQKMDALMDRAQAALTGLPETKDIKDLKADMQAAIKKAKK